VPTTPTVTLAALASKGIGVVSPAFVDREN
jgi:hypothetical protein